MKRPAKKTKVRHFIVPWSLFAGVVASFVACCMAGKQTTKTHQLVHFTRFHQKLSPESLFYPTASQVQRLVLARTKKERINVIIGGGSVLQGTGQRFNEVWVDKLAELLGPDYRVVNLACRGARTGEFGAIAAEMVLDRRRVILLTDISPGVCEDDPDGYVYRYFFWDAWCKRLIDQSIPRRSARMAELRGERISNSKFAELLRGAQLDSTLYFHDLWNTATYTTGSAVWNPICQGESFQPRKLTRDNEPGALPVAERPAAMERIVSFDKYKLNILKTAFKKGADGQWNADAAWSEAFKIRMDNILPNIALRQRTIVVVHQFNAHCVNRLSEDEQAHLSAQTFITSKVLAELGIRSVEMRTAGLTEEDHADHIHLSSSGGEKLGKIVAPAIRELAKSLGYEAGNEKK
ncbi:MAG: hypothetical protein ACAH88_03840 [Roseimicrobium sp.]